MDASVDPAGRNSPAAGGEPLARLLARVREHDEAAARELADRLGPLVARVVQANLPRRDDPEDLMQDVFLRVFSKLGQFRGEVPFEHWVSRIALNTCLDRLRRQRVRPELRWGDLSEDEQAMLETMGAETTPPQPDAACALELVEKLLEKLPSPDAWLIRRIELEELTLEQVCAETGWNSGAARVRLFRARRRLRDALRQLERRDV